MNRQRKQLIEVGRRLWERGLISGTDGNLSVRIDENKILATTSGVPKGFLSDEHFVEIDLQGKVRGRTKAKPSSEIQMHIIAYQLREDIQAVCHAHPPHATAFATSGIGITKCVIPELIVTLGSVPLAPYATPSTEEVPQSIAQYILNSDAVLLENHGALTLGKDIFEALYRMESIDHGARILILSESIGGPTELSRDKVEKLIQTRSKFGFQNPYTGCGD